MHRIAVWWGQIWPNMIGGALTGIPLYVWHRLSKIRISGYLDDVTDALEAHRKSLRELVEGREQDHDSDHPGG